jgi:hypothetical protein
MMAEFEGFIRAMMDAKRRGIPAEEVVLVSSSDLEPELRERLERERREREHESAKPSEGKGEVL